MGDIVYTLETVKLISRFLKRTKSVTNVELDGPVARFNYCCLLNRETVVPLAKALTKNQTITFLDLSCTNIGNRGMSKIIEAIKSNPGSQIKSINFERCGITNRGVRALLAFLKQKPGITVNLGSVSRIRPSLLVEIKSLEKQESSKTKNT